MKTHFDDKYNINIPVNYVASKRPGMIYNSDKPDDHTPVNFQFSEDDWEVFVNLTGNELVDLAERNPICRKMVIDELKHRSEDITWNGEVFDDPTTEWDDALECLLKS